MAPKIVTRPIEDPTILLLCFFFWGGEGGWRGGVDRPILFGQYLLDLKKAENFILIDVFSEVLV